MSMSVTFFNEAGDNAARLCPNLTDGIAFPSGITLLRRRFHQLHSKELGPNFLFTYSLMAFWLGTPASSTMEGLNPPAQVTLMTKKATTHP